MKHPISNGRPGMTSETGRAMAIRMMIGATPTRMKIYALLAGPLPSAAWAAASRAIGTRNGEHET
jgi:hypothetical protein